MSYFYILRIVVAIFSCFSLFVFSFSLLSLLILFLSLFLSLFLPLSVSPPPSLSSFLALSHSFIPFLFSLPFPSVSPSFFPNPLLHRSSLIFCFSIFPIIFSSLLTPFFPLPDPRPSLSFSRSPPFLSLSPLFFF